MPRRRSQNPFTTVRSEGGLLPPELLQRVVDADRALVGMAPGDYHLGPSERLNERISRSWNRLVGLWESFASSLGKMEGDREAGTGPTRERWLLPLFTELDFGRLQPAKAEEIDGKSFAVSHRWGSQVPIHLVGAGVDLDHRSPGVVGAAKASPHGLVQELLNRTDTLWGIVSNGRLLRLLRDNASLTRQAYVEFDLEAMMSGEVYADFALLFLLLHESRFEAERPAECVLEQWVQAAQAQGTRVREQLRTGVEKAIETLGAGFVAHPANAPLREMLRCGDLRTQDYYRQLLRLVYRLIFLFVAEDRNLLHPPGAAEEARTTYENYYSSSRLRNLAERRRGTRHPDLFEAIKLVTAALGLDDGAVALGLPFLGGFLFSPDACQEIDGSFLANVDLLGAVRALAFTVEDNVLRPVDYRNLGSEELGSVYESLLELHPEIDAEAAAFSLATAAGNERKTTGSYYTPTPLISALLDSALDPVLEEAASNPDAEPALLGLKVLDPACGSGHFLVAAAHRIARRLAAVRTGEDEPSPEPYRSALRDVISSCVYGIDVNPMAVELCKVSLWMEAVEPGKPLSFLDHHIVCGNSLLGTTPRLLADGIPDEAFAALEGDDRKVVSELRKRNRAERKGQQLFDLGGSPADLIRPVAQAVDALEHLPADSSYDLHEKERLWSQIEHSEDLAHAKLLADAWCAAFMLRKEKGAPALTEGVLRLLASDVKAGGSVLHDHIVMLASTYRFLHPHLAFPNVFRIPLAGEPSENLGAGWSGGFDVVIGNPPWDKVKVSDREFFASRDQRIAVAGGSTRKVLINGLRTENPALWREYQSLIRRSAGESHFLRNSGRHPLCGVGDVNTYAVFAETMRNALASRSRMGVIVPIGIATDDSTKWFFSDCIQRQRLISLFGFENEEFIFPGVHHAYKFCLLTISGPSNEAQDATFEFFARKISDLDDAERHFTLTPEDLALINPDTRTCPIFRTRRDANLTLSVYKRMQVLGSSDWNVSFLRLVHFGDHAAELIPCEQRSQYDMAELLPLYEAKQFHHFDHRFATWFGSRYEPTPLSWKVSPQNDLQFQYWVRSQFFDELMAKYHYKPTWLLVFRGIARATDARTIISSAIPLTAASIKAPAIDFSRSSVGWVLLPVMNSYVFDYLARQSVGGTDVTLQGMRQLPVPPPASVQQPSELFAGDTVEQFLRPRVLELTYTAWDLAGFGVDLGCQGSPFRWDDDRRRILRAEVDACLFHFYGLARTEVEYVLDTFPIVARREIDVLGEFRTKRLVLERYDAITRASSASPYECPLDPPPADPLMALPAADAAKDEV
jgi:hypothetical protein